MELQERLRNLLVHSEDPDDGKIIIKWFTNQGIENVSRLRGGSFTSEGSSSYYGTVDGKLQFLYGEDLPKGVPSISIQEMVELNPKALSYHKVSIGSCWAVFISVSIACRLC